METKLYMIPVIGNRLSATAVFCLLFNAEIYCQKSHPCYNLIKLLLLFEPHLLAYPVACSVDRGP